MGITSPSTHIYLMPFTKDRSVFANRRWVQVKDYPNHVKVTTLGGSTVKLSRTRTGESVKDYKTLIAQQKNATSDMSGTFDIMDLTDSVRTYVFRHLNFNQTNPDPYDVYEQRIDGVPPSFPTLDNPVMGVGVATNRAAIAFLKHARSVQSEFSSPIFLGELRETLRMIRNPAAGLRNLADSFLKDVKTAKKKTPKKWKKNLGGMWLEYAFGWTPLISDISEGYKAYSSLAKSRDGEQKPVSGHGIEEVEVPSRTATNYPFYFGTGGLMYGGNNYVGKDRCVVKYRGMVVRRVDVTLRDKLSRVGFNAEEFIPTVWELLPWSFLVDYFTNIGDVLTANAFNRADLAWVACSTIKFREIHGTFYLDHAAMKKAWPKHYVTSSGEPGRYKLQRRTVSRSRAVTVPFPSISLELPGKPAQFANMVALFAQAQSVHPQHFKFRR